MAVSTPLGILGPWFKTPNVVVVTDKANDPRVPLVKDAVDFWNQQLAELGSPFRLGTVREVSGPIPESGLIRLSQATLNQGGQTQIAALVKDYRDEIVIFMAHSGFVSFAAGTLGVQMMIAIRGENTFPCNMPNVCRNVIAHEMGHTIGLLHNSDPAMLMCGRPATCTPDLFASPTTHYFPLTDEDKARLLRLYPKDWTSH